MMINFVVILLMLIAFWTISYRNKVSDIEILNGSVTGKQRDIVNCSHSYSCNCRTTCSGSGKDRSCSQECETCYEHSFDFKYVIHSTLGNFNINTLDSQGLKEPNRYTLVKLNDPVVKKHRYNNYIKGSNTSIFNSKHRYTKKEMLDLPNYPIDIHDYYRINRIIDMENILFYHHNLYQKYHQLSKT
jgi:hypothetical protein